MTRLAPSARLAGAALAATALAGAAAAQPHAVASPDGRTTVTLSTEGGLRYAVARDGRPLVHPSRLGVVLSDGDTLGARARVRSATRAARDQTWTQPWGETERVRDHHAELRLALEEEDGRRMDLVVRAFDDGVGFRYEWPAQPGLGAFEIVEELTAFRLAGDPTAWFTRAQEENRYEYLTERMPLSRSANLMHTPLTLGWGEVESDAGGPYVAVHEAALVDYAAMSLRRAGRTALQAHLTPWSTGVAVYARAPHVSPWRVLMVGDAPTDLVTNTVVLNLNEPNALGDVSWAEPGKYVGIWWGMHLGLYSWGTGPTHGATTERTRAYVDFAAEHGFDGVLVEGWNVGWDGDWIATGTEMDFLTPTDDFDLEGLAAYARARGTRLIGHHETSGNGPHYESLMEAAYALMERLGMRAVKTGYVDFSMSYPSLDAPGADRAEDSPATTYEWNYGQAYVRHFQRTVEAAARHRVALNIHESVKDTGLRRTYPNLMTREAARGQEYNSPGGGGNGPDHVPHLAFTRMLAGPMDFTPGIFALDAEGPDANHVPTTLAGQLALYVVLYSPLQMAADLPENYAPHPDAFQFIKDVPADWSKTVALEGRIGGYVTIARRDRASDDWYLGAKAGGSARTTDVALGFLDAGRTYTATLYRDGEGADWRTNPLAYAVETRTVTAADRLAVPLAPGGGLAVRFVAN